MVWGILALLAIIFLIAIRPARRRLVMDITLSGPSTGKITARAETDLGAPAPLPAGVEWTSSDGTVVELAPVEGRPDQVAAKFLKAGTVTISAKSGDLTASLNFIIEEQVPVATKLILDFVADPTPTPTA